MQGRSEVKEGLSLGEPGQGPEDGPTWTGSGRVLGARLAAAAHAVHITAHSGAQSS